MVLQHDYSIRLEFLIVRTLDLAGCYLFDLLDSTERQQLWYRLVRESEGSGEGADLRALGGGIVGTGANGRGPKCFLPGTLRGSFTWTGGTCSGVVVIPLFLHSTALVL